MKLSKVPNVLFLILFLLSLFLINTSVAYAQSSSMDLQLNYVEGSAITGQYAFDVSAYFSLEDSAGVPVKDITVNDISASEDGKQVKITSLDSASDDPIYISLILDTSGSMGGSKIQSAKEAAENFIAGLGNSDIISVVTFNTEIKQVLDFTTDHASAKNQVELIDSIPNSGTCLYDAIYQTAQKTSALPLGRRAIIVLTDGKDELPSGGSCSTLTIDDDIDLASGGNTRVPVYTIGLGNSIDPASLKRLSSLTGGKYAFASEASQLNATFSALLDQLKSEYVLHYTSTAAPGTHTLSVQASYLGSSAQDSRSFVLPEFPLSISIISPSPDQEINGNQKIVAAITGQGQAINQVTFKVNDEIIGTVTQSPYELDWKPDTNLAGDVVISAAAIGNDGKTLAENNVKVKITENAAIQNSATSVTGTKENTWLDNKIMLYGGIAIVVILAGAIYFIFANKNRKKENSTDKEYPYEIGNKPIHENSMNELTMDGFVLSENALGAVTVMQSDDPAMLGQRFEISEQTTRLGRAADNDILFPKDGAVSRHHAILENRNGQLIFSEMVSIAGDGSTKTPTYGTFVNDQKVVDSVPLKNGDLIRLGKRLVLRFETSMKAEEDSEKTLDQFDVNDLDKTMDSL